MNKDQYLTVLNAYEHDASQNIDQVNCVNAELQRRYNGEPYGDELPERSSYVSNDVMDVIEADMPGLARSFLGAGKICVFQPTTDKQEDIEEAKQKTEYIDWIVRGQKDSFRVQHGFLKDIEINKFGALKFFMEEKTDKRQVEYENISLSELSALEESLNGENVQNVEIIARTEIGGNEENQTVSVTFEVTQKTKIARVIGVPPESLLLSSGATSAEDANLVGDKIIRTRGELLQEGFTEKQIIDLPTHSSSSSTLTQIRLNDTGGVHEDSFKAWSNESVQISDFVVMIDKDGDGIPERRKIIKSGNVILSDELFDIAPYVITSAMLISHSAIGISRAEITAPTALIQTTLKRGLLDNSYAHNSPQIGINDNVNVDDLAVRRPGGLVRVAGENNPGQSIFGMNIEYVGAQALQVIQYMDQSRAQTTGTLMASQGLHSDQFAQETAARFNGVQDASKSKIELVARVIAETAYKSLYDGLAWMVSQFQNTDVEIMVLGKALTVNPSNWKFKHFAKSTIGLGAGDGERTTETITGILNLQRQLKAEGSPLVDDSKIYNSIDSLLKSLDIHNTVEFFNNPAQPEQLIRAENEAMKAALQQAQQMLQQMQNPLAEAEKIKAEASLIGKKSDRDLNAAKLLENQRQFDVSAEQKAISDKQKLAFDLTKLEADTNKDIPGSLI
jgi:hypothetical protein